MNFKVLSILAVVALVFVFTAKANPAEEHVNQMSHQKEAEHAKKENAEKVAEERDGWMWELQKKFNKIPEHVRAELEKEVRIKWQMKAEEDAKKAHQQEANHAAAV